MAGRGVMPLAHALRVPGLVAPRHLAPVEPRYFRQQVLPTRGVADEGVVHVTEAVGRMKPLAPFPRASAKGSCGQLHRANSSLVACANDTAVFADRLLP